MYNLLHASSNKTLVLLLVSSPEIRTSGMKDTLKDLKTPNLEMPEMHGYFFP